MNQNKINRIVIESENGSRIVILRKTLESINSLNRRFTNEVFNMDKPSKALVFDGGELLQIIELRKETKCQHYYSSRSH